MGTKILSDIYDDAKLLITTITGFEPGEEGFRICERFVLSNIKHHRYLSVDSHATKRALTEVSKKFSIYGKYKVAKKFDDLINTFLTSFDFEHHPQYDLQWSLLCLLLNLSNETNKSDLKNLRTSRGNASFSSTLANESGAPEDIDWGRYLKEGQEEFFDDFQSGSDSEWSGKDDEAETSTIRSAKDKDLQACPGTTSLVPVKKTETTSEKVSRYLTEEFQSRNWLNTKIQNSWWNELEWRCSDTDSQFLSAHLCDLWNRSGLCTKFTATITEYQMCRELIWMFHAPSQMAVLQKTPENNFTIRENISISSLTPKACGDVVSKYCEFYRILNELDNFGKKLYKRYDESRPENLPPLTYEAYNSAISEHILGLRTELLEIEKKFMKQDDCCTFLALSRDLEKFMKRIRIIYDIHQAVTIDWEDSLNYKCATKLLSGLYRQMQNSSSRERTNLCASLYLSSLSVYLNIIATWLSEGRLEDWRSEFLIARIKKPCAESGLSENMEITLHHESPENFSIRQLDDDCSKDPVINLLCRRVKHMGRSIELLDTLDRISDMWEMNIDRDAATRLSLNDEFLNGITSEFCKYSSSNSSDVTDALIIQVKPVLEKQVNADANIDEQTLKMDNPFLMKAFEAYLPVESYSPVDDVDALDSAPAIGWGRKIFCELERISSGAILPFRKIFESTLDRILTERYSCASKLVKDILVKEYKLEAHLRLMRSVYMMESGHIMTQFNRLVFSEIESSSTWNNANSLSCILQEVLAQQWPDTSSRWSISVEGVRTHQVLLAADRITLHYAIGWPVNMVLSEDSLVKYNAVFRFQLKLKWALWTLSNLRFVELENNRPAAMLDKIQHFYARRLESLRFWLMHAIGSIHAYLSGQVLQSFSLALEKVFADTDNLDTIITVHNEYLEKVHEHCLQTSDFEDLMATINNMLGMCVHVRDRWKRGASALVANDLDVMEKSYTKYHTYIALTLHNAVQHKDADYYKLIPSTRDEMEIDENLERSISDDRITDLSRDLLTEVAHQSFPPSGIPIPSLVRKRSNYRIDHGELPEYVALNQYDQTFSYIRWYHYEENFAAMSRSLYDLSAEFALFQHESSDDES